VILSLIFPSDLSFEQMHGCAGSMMKIPRVWRIITGQGYTKNVEKSSKNGLAKWRRMKRLLTYTTRFYMIL
jgi:hypothetical protein